MKFKLIVLFALLVSSQTFAQYEGIENDINTNRKGELIIKAKPGAKVTVEQQSHEFWFGGAISNGLAGDYWSAEDKKQYKEKFLENFNSAVTENAVKWGSMERKQGEVNYATVDGILEWADANEIRIRGHNIFWGIEKFVQPWLKEMDDKELEATLKNRAYDVAERYKGRFVEYDLNNEMIHGNFYEDRLGDGITKKMTDWFHEKDPNAKLWLNDYDILTGKRLDDYMAQIRKFLSQGVPIAGIGVQGHLHAETFDRSELKRSLDSLSTFGLPIRITEFNTPGQRSKWVDNKTDKLTPEQELVKAQEIVDYYKICFAHPLVTGILQWGFWEGSNWIPASSMYRKDWSPTPAADAYQNLIYKQWWTKTSGVMATDGQSKVPAFYGEYKIVVDGVEKVVYLSKEKGRVEVEF
ncbi:endo-1,4-beta-xylanase [Arcticibacterium luteifluviistationis]|uniref:Beta-xylanase n=1 Tax=Arcticibacterium luteifluviistationis TaxID=1784714 RepID=A0A2Z4GG46_9BACT|nr:endo-1,4-beta-xylanase [Arcticibacterium luteifluviistationis]AWV99964.1 glycoside hydrolase [Arcticibacterium luteifluviistationis]